MTRGVGLSLGQHLALQEAKDTSATEPITQEEGFRPLPVECLGQPVSSS